VGTLTQHMYRIAVMAALALAAGPVLAQPIIEEILYDGPGSDADDVFTELFGDPGTSLDGWTLVGINGGSGAAYRTVDLTGAVFPLDGVLVLATEDAAGEVLEQRDFVAEVDWQNGPDAVQLRDPEGAIVDALQYGDAGEFNAGEGTPAPTVSSGQSLSRDAVGGDTDDNLADFVPQETPSPGVGPPLASGEQVSLPDTSGEVEVSLPDTSAAHGDSIAVPVRLGDTSGQGIVAVELFISYAGDLLTVGEVSSAGSLLGADWTLVAHTAVGSGTSIDTLKIAMATSGAALSGAGTLIEIPFEVADWRRPGQTSLTLEHVLFNDGTPGHAVVHGEVGVVGMDGVLNILPQQFVPPDALALSIEDEDEDRDPSSADLLAVRVESGADSEILSAVESGSSTAVFAGSMPVVLAAAQVGNGIIETEWGSAVVFCYDDSLDAAGQTVERCATAWAGGSHDARVEVTVVSQPGDTLRVQVIDLDLNLDTTVRETTSVSINSSITGDTEAVVLTEISVDDSVFAGWVETAADSSGSGDGILTAQGDEVIQVSYVDKLSSSGEVTAIQETSRLVGLFGDADGNGQVQAFDASRVLVHVLVPFLAERDSLAANVDSLAPLSAITPYDAALILQHRVGIRRFFPVQEAGASNHPQSGMAAVARQVAQECLLVLHRQDDYLSVRAEGCGGIISGELVLGGVAGRVELGDGLSQFLYAWRSAEELRVVLAGTAALAGPGELLRIYPEGEAAAARLERAHFNDGRIVGRIKQEATAGVLPARLALHPNHPNPFNPETTIRFDLPHSGLVRLDIFAVSGQRLRTLIGRELPAGVHRAVWDGRDERGALASSGIYFYRLKVGSVNRTRRMLLLK
jgi:hypothetical protein